MPTAALIERSGALLKHRHDLWEAGKGKSAGVMSPAWKESDAALESFRLDVAQHHRQEAVKLAAWNARLQRRHASVGNS